MLEMKYNSRKSAKEILDELNVSSFFLNIKNVNTVTLPRPSQSRDI